MKALSTADEVVVARPSSPPVPEPVAMENTEEDSINEVPVTTRVTIPQREPSNNESHSIFEVPHTARLEDLSIVFDKWEFKIRTPYVSDDDYSFSFGFDDKLMNITPRFECECDITYKGVTFHVLYGGTKLKFPGMPFTILSFFKVGEKKS